MDRGRILVVGAVPPPMHGVTVMTAALLESGLEQDHDVAHADTSDHRTVSNVGSFELTNVILALRHTFEFWVLLRRFSPHLVYLPLSQSWAGFLRDAALLAAARLARVRVIVHAHGSGFGGFYRRSPFLVRSFMAAALKPVQDIVVLVQAQRRQFDGWAPASARVSVIPNGVVDEWPGGAPYRRGRVGGTVLYLGTLVPEKGFLDVLEAVPEVLAMAPDTRFVFAGEPMSDKTTVRLVHARLSDTSVSRCVTFVGAVSAMQRHELLEKADVLVFPPRWEEGQPLVPIEAMSAGLPVVVTASGGITETLCDGVEGLVVPKSDSAAIAQCVLRLLSSSDLRTRLGSAARARYEAEFTMPKWHSRMRDVIGEAVERAMSG